jgi:hypothetical protein
MRRSITALPRGLVKRLPRVQGSSSSIAYQRCFLDVLGFA